MKEANVKKLHTILFQLYDILEKVKLWSKSKKISHCQRLGEGKGWKDKAEDLGALKLLCTIDTMIVDMLVQTDGMHKNEL